MFTHVFQTPTTMAVLTGPGIFGSHQNYLCLKDSFQAIPFASIYLFSDNKVPLEFFSSSDLPKIKLRGSKTDKPDRL